ncbi:MAG: hypothetical protein EZS28_026572 [Streblomastix strix]|uniref:Uncharacterized protein n=1 Tax=Streblomastix strix TaxID=222440 RepID=A0A5J4V5T5_9EUKA|nr:MAG: hypothetical protein EZS28_026572 [Streblomastix strix]
MPLVEYAGMDVIGISTAGGVGEEYDQEIYDVLEYMHYFFSRLHQETQFFFLVPSFQYQPQLAKNSYEQIIEECGSEEVDAQLFNKGDDGDIKFKATQVKAEIMNHFIDSSNSRPRCYDLWSDS